MLGEMKADIRNAVLATLAWHDALGVPLTPLQTWQYLVNPARLTPGAIPEMSLYDIVRELEHLAHHSRIVVSRGYYTLPSDRERLVELHLAREKIVAQKFKQLLRAARWLQAIPYLQALAASGSLALGTTEAGGDFDLFVVTRTGRLYTCRLFLVGLATLLGRRRRPHDRTAPDKFCFNHYVTDAGLAISHESIFTAQVYARLIPIYDRDVMQKFWTANIWLNKFIYHFGPDGRSIRRTVRPSRSIRLIARLGEMLLDTRVGEWVERLARWYQQRRIIANPLTHEPGGRVIATDAQLEFHPRSVEPTIIARYNEWLVKLGIPAPIERDSGISSPAS